VDRDTIPVQQVGKKNIVKNIKGEKFQGDEEKNKPKRIFLGFYINH
jgi:hypothetical protein